MSAGRINFDGGFLADLYSSVRAQRRRIGLKSQLGCGAETTMRRVGLRPSAMAIGASIGERMETLALSSARVSGLRRLRDEPKQIAGGAMISRDQMVSIAIWLQVGRA